MNTLIERRAFVSTDTFALVDRLVRAWHATAGRNAAAEPEKHFEV